MSKKYIATVDIDYLAGHLRYGHFEAVFNEEQKAEFDAITDPEEKAEFIRDWGEMVLDDFEVNDYGDFGDIDVREV